MAYLREALTLAAALVLGFYAVCLALRFLLPFIRSAHFNPIAGVIFILTEPVLRPVRRRLLPSRRGFDPACLLLLALLRGLEPGLLAWLHGTAPPSARSLALQVLPSMLDLFINLFLICILLLVVLSWINPGARHPGALFIQALAELPLRPARRFTPRLPGLDLSPLVAAVLLSMAKILVVAPLYAWAGAGRPW